MNGSYQLLKFLSRVCCRLSDRSAVKMGHILGEFFWMLIPNRRKKLALRNIFRGNITKDVKSLRQLGTGRGGACSLRVSYTCSGDETVE